MSRHFTFVASLGVLILTATLSQANNWPGWRGPDGNGISKETGINKDWAKKTPTVLWSVPMYDGGFGGPAIVDGVVYILDHKNGQDIVRALDEVTGKTIWESPFAERESETRSTVTVADGKLFAYSRNGIAVCMQITDGKILWKRDLKTELQGTNPANFGYGSSPYVDGKQVIFCSGNHAGSAVLALDVETGKTLWGVGSDWNGYGTPELATIDGIRQYVVFLGTACIGVDTSTGQQLWRIPWTTQENCSGLAPLVLDDSVMIGSGYGRGSAMFKIENNTPTQMWKFTEDFSSKTCSPILYNGLIFTIGENAELGCFDYKTGKIMWTKGGFSAGNWTGGMCMADGVLFVMNHLDSAVVLVQPTADGYQELGRIPVPHKCIDVTAPAFADKRLFVRNQKDLVCFDMSVDGPPAPSKGSVIPPTNTPPTTTPPTTTPPVTTPPVTTPPVTTPPAVTGLPDLVVTSISWTPATPKAGDTVTFEAIVKNQGTAPTPDGVIIGVRFLVDDAPAVIWSDNETNALAPGKSVAVDATGGTAGSTWMATTGAHTVTAIVDDVNRIEESNEDNNTLKATLTVP